MSKATKPLEKTTSEQPSPSEIRESNLKVYDRVLATVSILGIVSGGIWGFYSHIQQRVAEASQKDKEIELRKHELDLLIFQERKEAYLALCDAACEIVACKDRQEVAERSRAFRKMYYGRAHIIADPDPVVGDMKVAFNNKLTSYLTGDDKESTKSPYLYFGGAALDLTKSCRKHIDPRQLSSLGQPGVSMGNESSNKKDESGSTEN